MKWETVIGLEVHVELNTKTKIFCSCTTAFGGSPNSHCCPICTGQPGTLPKLNEKVLESAVKTGIALGCRINKHNRFDRKNYFYPDLPKAYQISQLYLPFAQDGCVEITTRLGKKKAIRIHEIHMEEDAGKLVHSPFGDVTYPDWNRCGVPLLEIVSEPDFHSGEEVSAYLEKLKSVLTYLGVSDCKMEEGSMRADVNLSVRPAGTEEYGVRTEMKNLNSLKSIERAIDYESSRQIESLEEGKAIVQETRRWDENRGKTYAMRSKENAQDYRYFPEPDIPPISISEEMIRELTQAQPEMADAKKARYMEEYGLTETTAGLIAESKHFAKLYEEVVGLGADSTETANWLGGHLRYLMGQKGLTPEGISIRAHGFAKFIGLITQGRLGRNMAKGILEKMLEAEPDFDVEAYIKKEGLELVCDSTQIEKAVAEVLEKYEQLAFDYLAGDEKLYGFFIGQCMERLKGKANPATVNQLVKKALGEIEKRTEGR
ncbi:MAG: Asp-tRNA(Asn)/Glu-tRNA(Gln) amidotransferase subunit GatB [Firmicutes bacterium]|nr:Asp-tRNA(Asn)/Glu-tRNA(Gln) amidotransferase subunit GatB [Bacillota bacterium]